MLLPLLMNLGMLGASAGAKRSYIELEGRLKEVSGWEEAQELLSQIKQVEKQETKQRKKLKILLRKLEVALPKEQPKIQREVLKAEQKLDDLLAKAEELQKAIEIGLRNIDEDDEEVLLLSH